MTTQELIMKLSVFSPDTEVFVLADGQFSYSPIEVFRSFGGATIETERA